MESSFVFIMQQSRRDTASVLSSSISRCTLSLPSAHLTCLIISSASYSGASCSEELVRLLLLLLASRGRHGHCAALRHTHKASPTRETRAPSRSSARHHPRHELLPSKCASTARSFTPINASLSTRDHQRHQPMHTHTVSLCGAGGGR